MSSSRKRTGVHSLLFQRELTGRRRTNLLLWSRELMYGSGRSASYIPLPETAKSTIALAFSADGEYFASTHGDHTVKVRPPLPCQETPGATTAMPRPTPWASSHAPAPHRAVDGAGTRGGSGAHGHRGVGARATHPTRASAGRCLSLGRCSAVPPGRWSACSPATSARPGRSSSTRTTTVCSPRARSTRLCASGT